MPPHAPLPRLRDRLFPLSAGLRRVGPTTASILATVEPLVTVLLAYLVPVQLTGGALVLAAVIAINARRRTTWT